MEDTKKIFMQEINGFIDLSRNTTDKDTIKIKYLELVKKYHPDVNNEIDKGTLNEYMILINNSYEKAMDRKASKNSKPETKKNNIGDFSFDIFLLLLIKITQIGIDKDTAKNKIFTGYTNLLITEIEKSSNHVAEAVRLLFSKKVITNYSERIDLFSDGIKQYAHLLAGTPSKEKEEMADGLLTEYKEYCRKQDEKDAIDTLTKWLKEIKAAAGFSAK
jgi:curved DNA-binding protein CbpA